MADRALGNPLGNPLGLAKSVPHTKVETVSPGDIVFSQEYLSPLAFLPADGNNVAIVEYPDIYKKYGQSNRTFKSRLRSSFSPPAVPSSVSGLAGKGSLTGTWILRIPVSGGSRIFRSVDDSATWSEVAVGSNLYAVDTDNNGNWYGVGATGYLVSTDDGVSWSSLPSPPSVTSRLVYTGRRVCAYSTSERKLYSCAVGGGEWVDSGLSFVNADVSDMASNGRGMVIIGGINNRGYVSQDYGETWAPLATPVSSVNAVATNGSGVWAIGGSLSISGYPYYQVFVSLDEGTTWSGQVASWQSSSITKLVLDVDELVVFTSISSGTTTCVVTNLRNPATRQSTYYSWGAAYAVVAGPPGRVIRTVGTTTSLLYREDARNSVSNPAVDFQLPYIQMAGSLRPYIKT